MFMASKLVIPAKRVSSEHFNDPVESLEQPVDLFGGVVKCQAGPERPADPEMVHYRLVAMSSGTKCEPQFIQHHTRIVGMDAIQQEGKDPDFLGCRAVDLQAGYGHKFHRGVFQERML